jgi:outer membrane protein TolC
MRADAVLLLCVGLAGCATLTRPEGTGGWTPDRRQEELAARADAAKVALDARPESTAPARLDLREALALAAGGNRRIADAERLVAAARERVWDARGRLLPETTASARYTWYTDRLTNQLPGTLAAALTAQGAPASALPTGFTIRDEQFGTVNGALAVPLDVTGELQHVLTAAQAGYRGERARLWATTLDQQALVVRSYFDVLEAERLREVTDQTIAFDRQQLADAQTRFDAGRLTKNELLVVQVALKNAEQLRVRQDLTVDRARWALNETLGLPVDAPTEPVDVLTAPAAPAIPDALRTAYAHNPVLVALVEEQQRLNDTATALVRSRLPRLGAGAGVDYTSSSLIQPQEVGSGYVGMTWDLGTDGRREAQIAEARIEADRNRIAVESELRELEDAVRVAQRAVEERLSALAATQTSVVQAEENLRIRRQQFGAGRATSEDVLEAEALLTEQRATLAAARYQAYARRAELQQLMGLPLDDVAPGE